MIDQDDDRQAQEPIFISPDALKTIGLVLEGMKLGRGGNIHPMGTVNLEELWEILHFLRGDVRYKLKGYELLQTEGK